MAGVPQQQEQRQYASYRAPPRSKQARTHTQASTHTHTPSRETQAAGFESAAGKTSSTNFSQALAIPGTATQVDAGAAGRCVELNEIVK